MFICLRNHVATYIPQNRKNVDVCHIYVLQQRLGERAVWAVAIECYIAWLR